MIRTIGKFGADGKTIIWYFVVSYTGRAIISTRIEPNLNRKGAVTFFRKMIVREKKQHLDQERLEKMLPHEHIY